MGHIYVTVLIIYIIAVIVVTLVFRKKTDDQQFWTEGRSTSGLMAGISLSATFMSISWSVVYGIEVFLQNGLKGFFILSLPWILVLIVLFILAPFLRNIPVFSQPELIMKKFGNTAGKLSTLPILFVFVIWGGAELDLAASLLSSTTGISQLTLTIAIFLTISTYMSFSGTRAVILTDVMQYLLVAVFFIIIIGAGISNNEMNTELLTFSSKTDISWLFIALTFLAYLPGWLAETDIWIRLQVTKNGREARKAMGIAIFNSVLFVFIFPLLAAAVCAPKITDGLSAVSSLLALINNPLVAGLAAIGLIAASMSTIDTCANVSAMTISYDMIETPHRYKNIAAVWIAGILSLLFAWSSDSLKDAFYLSSALLSTSLFLPVLACFTNFGNKKAVTAVLLTGPPVTIFFYFMEKLELLQIKGANGISYILFAMIVVILVFTVFTLNKKNTENDMS